MYMCKCVNVYEIMIVSKESREKFEAQVQVHGRWSVRSHFDSFGFGLEKLEEST